MEININGQKKKTEVDRTGCVPVSNGLLTWRLRDAVVNTEIIYKFGPWPQIKEQFHESIGKKIGVILSLLLNLAYMRTCTQETHNCHKGHSL